MSTILKIPMSKDFLEELDDAFVGQKIDAHDFVWQEIKKLCKDAKLGKLNKNCVVNVIRDGRTEKETIKLKEVELKELPHSEKWIPINIEAEDVGHFEHKITDKTEEYLKLYGSFTLLRHEKYADSIVTENDKRIAELKEKETDSEKIEKAETSLVKTKQVLEEGVPTCLEEAIYNAIYPAIHRQISDNIDVMFDKENEEMYPKEEKPSK